MVKVLVLAGGTAVGKTALAIQWAQEFGGAILNADSRQIYRYMDIGTAKPSPAEQAAAPHHLLNIVAPDETLTLAGYQAAAYEIINSITELPILTGGTGMYLTAVTEGWRAPEVPPNPELRAELETMSNAELLAKLRILDPVTAERIDPDNPRRLVRAVEVCLISGQPFSELRQKEPPGYDALYFAMIMPREDHYARADARLEIMIKNGWIEEVQRLLEMDYTPSLPSFSALGYPQIAAYLRGEKSLADAKEEIRSSTRSFIRRQYTWLRGHDPGWNWLEPGDDPRTQIATWLSR